MADHGDSRGLAVSAGDRLAALAGGKGLGHAAELLVIGFAYFLLAKLGLALASIHPSATPIWPPTGLALAAVMLRGQRVAPAIFVGALLANATTAGTLYTSAGIALGNMAEGMAGGYLVGRWCGGIRAFDTPGRIARFALTSLGLATPISATIGIGSLALAGFIEPAQIGSVWITWWLGDVAGALVLTPVLVLWFCAVPTLPQGRHLGEAGATLAVACLVGLLVFAPFVGPGERHDVLGFLIIVPLMWAALRLGRRETATVALLLSCLAVWGTQQGAGPFARATLNDSFLLLVMFMISTALPALALSADVAVRRRTEESLRGAHAALSRQVETGLTALEESQRALAKARRMETALRESDDRLRHAIDELDHRVRNILAGAQSMLTLTARNTATKEELATALQGRISAMAQAHALLTRGDWKGIELSDLLAKVMRPYREAVDLRGGPGCILPSRDATGLALALHELATNAAKYGALSVAGGRVELSWGADLEGSRILLVWQESGGPPVRPPMRRGFGSQLIRGAVPKVDLQFAEAGVRCSFELKPGGNREDGALAAGIASASVASDRAKADPELPLRGERILIVEDEALPMLALKAAVEEAGAEIAGTGATLAEANGLLQRSPTLAVLDINLAGEMSFPLAERLLERGVPVLFATGYDAAALVPEHLRGTPTLQKPIDAKLLVRLLAELAHAAQVARPAS